MREGRIYDDLVSEAVAAPFSGWDFSFLEGRVRDCEIPWSYEDLARSEVSRATRLLDLDTGGGETLIEVLAPMLEAGVRPTHIVATESWEPNVPIARQRLEPIGIAVRDAGGESLPADDAEFDLVLNRHGGGDPVELRRVLAPGGVYLSQGVGRRNDVELNTALGGPPPGYSESATLGHIVVALEGQGFEITRAEETFAEFGFCDIGAVVFHLRAVSWQIPGFSIEAYDRPLRKLDARIRDEGSFVVRHHRTLVRAARR